MNKPKKTEKEYMEHIIGLVKEGKLRSVFRRVFSVGVLGGLVWLVIAGGAFFGYLRLGGSKEDWHFVFGFIVGTMLFPGIFILGISLARMLRDIESQDSRPFTLMVKYHNHLLRAGLDPYEETSPGVKN